MIGGVILAAGASQRMGQNKALLPLGGQRIVERLIEVYLSAGLAPVYVVGNDEVRAGLAGEDRIELLRGDPRLPMIDSLARAVVSFAPEIKGAVVQPVDAPLTTREMIEALLAGGDYRSRVLCHEGRPGHPVFLHPSVFDEVLRRPKGGLRRILAETEIELVEWEDPNVLADVDTPEDFSLLSLPSRAGLH